jgi:hypothetical protein
MPMPKPSIGACSRANAESASSSIPPLAKMMTPVSPPSSRMRRTLLESAIRSPLSRRTLRTLMPAAASRGASDQQHQIVGAGPAHHRWTNTGVLECVSTFIVSLPKSTAEMPWRPWEAMTIRSQPFDAAVSMIA